MIGTGMVISLKMNLNKYFWFNEYTYLSQIMAFGVLGFWGGDFSLTLNEMPQTLLTRADFHLYLREAPGIFSSPCVKFWATPPESLQNGPSCPLGMSEFFYAPLRSAGNFFRHPLSIFFATLVCDSPMRFCIPWVVWSKVIRIRSEFSKILFSSASARICGPTLAIVSVFGCSCAHTIFSSDPSHTVSKLPSVPLW